MYIPGTLLRLKNGTAVQVTRNVSDRRLLVRNHTWHMTPPPPYEITPEDVEKVIETL